MNLDFNFDPAQGGYIAFSSHAKHEIRKLKCGFEYSSCSWFARSGFCDFAYYTYLNFVFKLVLSDIMLRKICRRVSAAKILDVSRVYDLSCL